MTEFEINMVLEEFSMIYGVQAPGLVIEPGAKISISIPDAHGYDRHMNQIAGRPNPLAGPFLIPGAVPGDTLSVTIHSLKPNRSTGFACKDIHPLMQEPPKPIAARRREYVAWDIDLKKGFASPSEGSFKRKLSIPVKPVLGCIGVALNKTDQIASQDCGSFGGNMDYPRIAAGSTLHLPVYVKNGYLFMGDGHAAQGAGEITGNGIETSCEIIFSVALNQHGSAWLAGEDNEYIYTIANTKPLEKGMRIATAQMLKWLSKDYGMNEDQAGILLGQLVNYEVGNLVSNAFTAACCFPKAHLP